MEDKRFSKISKDPKLRRVPKKEQKVKIDNRFQSMFKDKKFNEDYTVDERGRPVKRTTTRDLKRYYHHSTSEESDSDCEDAENKSESAKQLRETHADDKKVSDDVKNKLKNLKVDYARGEKNLFSESSSDDDLSENEDVDEDGIEHKWGELDAEADTTEDITRRLAACNMDWDRIRAVDIMVLLNSFLPPTGSIESVKIYLSEFGKKRLAEEDVSGPPELRGSTNKVDGEGDEEQEEGSKYHMEKLRQYQLNRLKYYYAVITFSDENTSNKIYTECDGIEYESSANKIDLRFVPDDTIFDEEPKEICEKMPDMTKYQPRFFITTALQQAKVDLTWDETNPDRIELTQKLNKGKLKLDEIDDNQLKNFVALSEDEESEEEKHEKSDSGNENNDNPIEKYRALLLDIEEKEKEKQEKDIQMEVTWGLELEKKSEELVKQKISDNQDKTPFEKYLDKRKEKRKEKRKNKKQQKGEGSSDDESGDIPSDVDMNDPYFAEEFKDVKVKKKKPLNREDISEDDKQKQAELELLLMSNEDDSKRHFNLKKIQDESSSTKKSKRNKKNKIKDIPAQSTDDFEVKVNDPRFSAVYSSHLYNIDPSDPHFKKTKGMERFIEEKLKRRNDNDEQIAPKKIKKQINKNAELSCLVKSIKRKTEALNRNK